MYLFEFVFAPNMWPGVGIAGSYDNSIFSLLRNLYTVFHRGHINLHSTNSIRRVGEGIS